MTSDEQAAVCCYDSLMWWWQSIFTASNWPKKSRLLQLQLLSVQWKGGNIHFLLSTCTMCLKEGTHTVGQSIMWHTHIIHSHIHICGLFRVSLLGRMCKLWPGVKPQTFLLLFPLLLIVQQSQFFRFSYSQCVWCCWMEVFMKHHPTVSEVFSDAALKLLAVVT